MPYDSDFDGAMVFTPQSIQNSEPIIENDDIDYNSLYPSEMISSAFAPDYLPLAILSGTIVPYIEEPVIDLSSNMEAVRNLFMNARPIHLVRKSRSDILMLKQVWRNIIDTLATGHLTIINVENHIDVPIPREINISAGAIRYNPLQLPYFTSSENDGDATITLNINTMDELD